VRGVPGVVFELGLGNGRTYDHLRQLCPEREIFVFDRQVDAHPDCIPDAEHLYLGDVQKTLPQAAARFAGRVALLHADIGTGEAARNAELAAAIAPWTAQLIAPGGIVLSDQPLDWPDAEPVALPEGVQPGRYHARRRPA
jgi:hypothetical protein